tara:strand:- start:358 stop:570 length:213 start_codon:yes stop_codon:yes gene_type:complete
MRQYKVNFVEITKRYTSASVDAESKQLAITKAKALTDEQFEEKETRSQIIWEAKSQVSLFANFINFLKGK